MLQAVFHAWERRLADVTKDRVVRPFDWGLDWIPANGHRLDAAPADVIGDWVSNVMADTDAFFTPPPTTDYTLTPAPDGDLLTFPSALTTPHDTNNTVYARFFPARGGDGLKAVPYVRKDSSNDRGAYVAHDLRQAAEDRGAYLAHDSRQATEDRGAYLAHDPRQAAEDRGAYVGHDLQVVPPSTPDGPPTRAGARNRPRAAVLVLPQWNSDPGGHLGLSRLLAWNGMSALRLSLPYHDQRMPAELRRADYIVSANVARTVQVCRQAVLDARRAIAWLAMQGYDRIGILGTSLGSCLALLTTAHEPLIRVQALNHISPYFADVVWRGISTRHVREGMDGHIELDLLRTLWRPISPRCYLERLRNRRTLLVYARYDLTFPVDLSEDLVSAFREQQVPHEVAVLRCGHYSTGKTPFKFVDGWILTRFLKKALSRSG